MVARWFAERIGRGGEELFVAIWQHSRRRGVDYRWSILSRNELCDWF